MRKSERQWMGRSVVVAVIAALSTACSDAPAGPDTVFELSAASSSARKGVRTPDLGSCQNLAAPAGTKLAAHVYAAGVQIYHWNGASWIFDGPSAQLTADAGGKGVVGTHYAGPTWESNGGGTVVGAVIDRCTPDPTAVPWLLLGAVADGPGLFHRVTYIQRLNTVGGIAPAAPGTSVGEEARVPYTTEYLFYRPQGIRLRRPLALKALRMVVGGLTAIFAAVLLAQALAAAQGSEVVSRLQAMIDPASDHNVKFRMIYWGLAAAMLRERPLGWGFGVFKERYGFSTHNELLGQLVGGGWVATGAFVLLLGLLWWHVIRMRRNTPVADAVRFAALCLLSMTCLAMVTENVTVSLMNTYMPLFWTVIGLSFGVHHHNGGRQRPPAPASSRAAGARRWHPPRPARGEPASRG